MNHYNVEGDVWDIEITPARSWFSIDLKGLWAYRDLLVLFVKRDFAAKYKQTLLGPVWHFIQPILTTLVSFLLFNVVANIGTNGQNKVLFQMSGIVIWNYFSVSLTTTSNTFVTNAKLFGKVYFPRLISPLSVICSNLIQLGIQMVLLILTMFYFYFKGETFPISTKWFALPLIILILALLGLGLGIIISSMTTKYRDLSVLVQFGVQLLMFASAVNYPISELSSRLSPDNFFYAFVKYNPITWLIDAFRNCMLNGPINWSGVAYSASFAVVLLAIGIIIFNRVEKTFMDTV